MNEKNKILIVEDEIFLLKSLADEFTAAGFEVFQAKNGEEGLRLATNNFPDLIMIDILMPKMDGITMLKKIREQEKNKKTPVIVLTNLSDTETITKALENGAYDYLVKSDWEPKTLVKRVKEKLNIV